MNIHLVNRRISCRRLLREADGIGHNDLTPFRRTPPWPEREAGAGRAGSVRTLSGDIVAVAERVGVTFMKRNLFAFGRDGFLRVNALVVGG